MVRSRRRGARDAAVGGARRTNARPEFARRGSVLVRAAPLMFLLDLPFVATGVHVMVPFWPELTLLWTAWLTFPMTAGARLITEAAASRDPRAPSLVGGGRRRRRARRRARAAAREPCARRRVGVLFFPIRRVRRVLDRSAHGLCAAWRTGCASWGSGARERRLAWRWTTRACR